MTNVRCIRCGVVNVLSNEICRACGLELSSSATYAQTPRTYYPEFPRSSPLLINAIKPFDGVAEALGSTVTIFSKNFWLITKLVLVIVTPFEIFKALSIGDTRGNWQLAVGTFALQIFCNILIAPALIYALMKVMQTGVTPGVNESYRFAVSKLIKVLLCTVMAWVLVMLGFVLLVIPGIILFLAFELVYPVAVLEGGSPTEILKRSYTMTKGYRWNILGATFLMSVMLAIASAPVSILVAMLAFNGFAFWPLQIVGAIVSDVLGEATTVLSLVIYLGILRTLESRQSLIE
jgi:hypothetical protein